MNQNIADNSVTWKRGKNIKSVFYLIELSLWNTFVLYKKVSGKKNALDSHCIMEKTIACHLKDEFFPTSKGNSSVITNPCRLSDQHFPVTHFQETSVWDVEPCSKVQNVLGAKGKKTRRELLIIFLCVNFPVYDLYFPSF